MTQLSRKGQLALNFPLSDVPDIVSLYYEKEYDPSDPQARVLFGTSGHRGSPVNGTYMHSHIEAISQAIADERKRLGITGPLFLGKDTHALSSAAYYTALRVLTANGVEVVIDSGSTYTPTPVISRQIVRHNLSHPERLADGIIITPSHNPPEDGGFKYNPPHGGPASPDYTRPIEERANALLKGGLKEVKMLTLKEALESPCLHREDFKRAYLDDLSTVIDLRAIAESGLRLLVNAQGGASIAYWEDLQERCHLPVTLMNDRVDGTFFFIPYDYDEHIRMDCMSPYTMQPLIDRVLKEGFDFGIANDPDADRHGVVTSQGLLNSNCYLSSMIDYLLSTREYPAGKVGKTIGASMFMDRVIKAHGREVFETPIGFKWFAKGLFDRELVFGCEESAGASFLDFKGRPFTTDKDGFLAGLIGAELMAKTGLSLDEYYAKLTSRLGQAYYGRADVLITRKQKEAFKNLNESTVRISTLAGCPVTDICDHARGNHAPIGGIKVVADKCWFSARPSGTENLYKIYYESFVSPEHREQVREEAEALVGRLTGL